MGKPNSDMRAALQKGQTQKPELEIVESVPKAIHSGVRHAAAKRWQPVIFLWTHTDNSRYSVPKEI